MSVHYEWTDSRKEAVERNPGAVKIVKVEGGYAIFDSDQDFQTWKNQK